MNGIEGMLKQSDGVELYYHIKEVDSPYWLIATHGIGEHCDRHLYLDKLFNRQFNVFRYDLRGHGRSQGNNATHEFSQFFDDLEQIVAHLKSEFKMKHYILFGHSMGALITAGYLQGRPHEAGHFFTYLSSPPVEIGGGVGEFVKLVPSEFFKQLSRLKKGMKLPGMVDPKQLSTDLSVGEDYMKDPLTMKSLHTKLLLGLVSTAREVFSRPLRIPTPTVCSVGSNDKVVSVSELVKYFTLVDKSVKLRIFNGARHEVHNEVESIREEYFSFLEKELLQSVGKD